MMSFETHVCPKCRGINVSIDLETNELTCNKPGCGYVGKSHTGNIFEVIKKHGDEIYKGKKTHQDNLLYMDPKMKGFL